MGTREYWGENRGILGWDLRTIGWGPRYNRMDPRDTSGRPKDTRVIRDTRVATKGYWGGGVLG